MIPLLGAVAAPPRAAAPAAPMRRRLRRVAAALLPLALGACASLHFPLDAPRPGSAASAPPAAASAAGRVRQWGDPPVPTSATLATATATAATAGIGAADEPPPAADPAYAIGPEDVVEIAVWKDETLKAAAVVRPDGGISFPLIGEIAAAGKTAAQLRKEITQRLEKYIPEAVVTVSVARVGSYRVYVLGRVNKPGDYAVGRRLDVLQALSLAGGMTPFADEDEIRIIRKVDGRSISIPFHYSRVRKAGDLSENITLRSGDVLLVP